MAITKGFWSGETLHQRLQRLISPFDPDRIDCSAYTLAMGREVYVSPNDETADPQSVTIRQLGDGEAFTIPPGQFAFLLSEEKVEIPDTALALISIKAKIKWRGLINVSGFHVDPGFRGRLIFSVYNAGPVPVHLRQGQPMFLIWYASLDAPTKLGRRQPVQESFPPDLISGISGELQSLAGMNKKIKDIDKTLTERVHALEREQSYYRSLALVIVLLVTAIVGTWIKDGVLNRLFDAPAVVHP
ncbi:MAG: dCTP deaminase domain-containing protein, partial [Methylocella sp.]